MSADSNALLLRRNARHDITTLAKEHLKHDLQDSNRDALNRAASKIRTHVVIGSAIGLGLGFLSPSASEDQECKCSRPFAPTRSLRMSGSLMVGKVGLSTRPFSLEAIG